MGSLIGLDKELAAGNGNRQALLSAALAHVEKQSRLRLTQQILNSIAQGRNLSIVGNCIRKAPVIGLHPGMQAVNGGRIVRPPLTLAY